MGMPGIIAMALAADEGAGMGPDQAGDRPPSINASTTIALPRMPESLLTMLQCYTAPLRHSRRAAVAVPASESC